DEDDDHYHVNQRDLPNEKTGGDVVTEYWERK
ncbi:uncharacterized protein METZ01_LOCUS325375, partial [marine metagenome]